MDIQKKDGPVDKIIRQYNLTDILPPRHYPHLMLKELPKGSQLFEQSEPAEYLYFLLLGKVRVYRTLSNGKMFISSINRGFSILGEIELIYGSTALNSVDALAPCKVIFIPMDYCREVLMKEAGFVKRLAYNLAETLYIVETNQAISMSYSLEARMASYILSTEKNGYFEMDLRILPEVFGTTYRHLLRVLKKFREEQLIEKCGELYKIINKSTFMNQISDLYYKIN